MECAARKPSQVRIRGLELLLTQFRDAAIEQAKEQAELDKTAIKELTEANTVLVEQVKAVSDELSNVNGQLSAERWKTKSIEGLQKRIDELIGLGALSEADRPRCVFWLHYMPYAKWTLGGERKRQLDRQAALGNPEWLNRKRGQGTE